MKTFLKNNTLKLSAVFTMLAMAAFAVVGSGSTTALWSDSSTLGAASINSGNLNVAPLASMTWQDISGTPAAIPAIASFNAVPGDVVEGTQSLAVALNGSNMTAKLDVLVPNLTGALASSMTVTYSVYDSTDALIASATNVAAGTTGTVLNLTPSTPGVSSSALTSKAFTVKIKATFNSATSGRTNAAAAAALGASTITVTQVRA